MIKSLSNIDFKKAILICINCFFSIILFFSIIFTFRMNLVGRSFWIDEASLMWSIWNRGLFELTSSPLEANQSAPVLYLYIVKFLQLIFGDSEFVFRLPSFISYLGLVFFTFKLLKRINVKFPIIGTTFVSSFSIIMMYASELKQYITESFLVMVLIYLYSCYLTSENKKESWGIFLVTAVICIWGGNPCCFVIGGILLVELIQSICIKDRNKVIVIIMSGILILFDFFLYYLYWLKPVIDAGEMTDYWGDNKFDILFFLSKERTLHMVDLIGSYLSHFGNGLFIIIPFSIYAVIYGLIKNNKVIEAFVATIFITVAASSLGLFPIQDRICLFLYPIILIMAFFGISNLFSNISVRNSIVIMVIGMLLWSEIQGLGRYYSKSNIMRYGEEINGLIEYMDCKDDDYKLYLYVDSLRDFQYKTGVDNRLLGHMQDNVIYGKGDFYEGNNREDIDYLIDNPNSYLLFNHIYLWNSRVNPLFDELSKNGYLYLIKVDYGTPLYYYSDILESDKLDVSIECEEIYNNIGDESVVVCINNTGEYYVGNDYNRLIIRSTDGCILQPIDRYVSPNDSIEVNVPIKGYDKNSIIELELVLDDQYDYQQVGCNVIRLQYTNEWELAD